MTWTPLDTWIVVAGALACAASALLGNFLLLKRMSMMGDAISHAVLPGIALGFLLTNSRASLPMFLGAAAVGVLTALLSQWIHTLGRVDQGAAMGVVFTTLFAIGLILIVHAADKVDLDPGCVLYGALEFTPLDTVPFFGWQIPRAVLVLGSMFLINALFVLVFFKELRLSSFDAALSTTLGFNAKFINLVLMALVAVTTVAVFEAVGSIIVIAMLIVPAATAHLLTERLKTMIYLSVVIAVLSAVAGHSMAVYLPPLFGTRGISSAGMMAVASGMLLTMAVFFAPKHGIIANRLSRKATNTI